ncbi:hypothetical protein CC86DRAFT_349080 [Ophiobolus disseminans]|uniref:polynucleotide adenylyltransferase n=1 Tax=Ophiobolus disseminans TaxID=1469910 RepID=A0A6A7A319_9PLEO|nr:hypothetical protein CC86DRAFT_349080 [Ophiobolus disseminans]
MAEPDRASSSLTVSIKYPDTALCVIPPDLACEHVDLLRELYDKDFAEWPAHIKLIHPFVKPASIPRARQLIQAQFDRNLDPRVPKIVTLDEAGLFKHQSNSTVFLQDGRSQSTSCLETLRSMALQALGQQSTPANLHLTIGQTKDNTLFSQQFLLEKARLLPTLRFQIGTLAVLIREPEASPSSKIRMRYRGFINIAQLNDAQASSGYEHWLPRFSQELSIPSIDVSDNSEPDSADQVAFSREVHSGQTYRYEPQHEKWISCDGARPTHEKAPTVTVSSYNVLVDSEYPPARDRDPYLVRTILSGWAISDILVLQEVSDDFLSYMLCDPEVQRRYPYTSHGPPSQPEIGPLSSLRNVVILSRWCFDWEFVPFHRRHKGALVAKFTGITANSSSGVRDLVVAGVHLTCGLTDGSVAAKKVQLQNLTSNLTRHHSTESWIIAGDFNLTTSTYTISGAIEDKSISSQTVTTLSSIETAMSELGLIDAWAVAHVEAADEVFASATEDLFEGEEGATFDPRSNVLAAATSGTSNHRPQRYDRVLVRAQDTLRVSSFNHFGLPEDVAGAYVVPSDHSGIRATFGVMETSDATSTEATQQPSVKHIRATLPLSNSAALKTVLLAHRMFPTEVEVQQRQKAFSLLKEVVLGASNEDGPAIPDIPMVVVPVGSYALDVWTSESDIDCLCIGVISSKTFFKLARQRLARAVGQGVRILRKVEANTGTMLELSINGVALDLQYCPATRIVERWSEFHNLPASDPIFNLSILSLRKLKPYRDLLYIQRTLPSLSAFRLAYRCIKLWAIQRGIYSAKFGYLGGVHITLVLSWAAKSIAHDSGPSSTADLIASFFYHFAQFDWANEMMYDALFHKKVPRYHRSAREPMVVVGYHAPNSNIAHTSTVPGLRTLVREAKVASELLSDPSTTWEQFFGGVVDSHHAPRLNGGADSFLKAHSSYVKIDIQFWGRTLAKGKSLVGWVESRCLSLVVDIHKAFPELEVRIWPARFTDSDPNSDYHGCYLIGLSKTSNSTVLKGHEDKQLSKQTLDKLVDRFVTHLRTDEKNYNASMSWIDVSLTDPKDVKGMKLDEREWGEYVVDLEPDSDDDEEIDDLSDEMTEPIRRTIPQRPKPTATPVSTSKLRPASDVLNRLRWDPNLDPADYIIGYEDRFLGAKEMGLENWKTEQTDEEFIPQHRILYYKKKGDDGQGEVVWERATRIDKVFGSGAGTGEDKGLGTSS